MDFDDGDSDRKRASQRGFATRSWRTNGERSHLSAKVELARVRRRAYTVRVAKLFLLFTIVPVLELFLLMQLKDLVGLWPTIGVVVVTGFTGALLARAEGTRVLMQWKRSMVRGKLPEDGILSGLLILVGGVLLVTPGVVTDVLGFCLLIPPTRRAIAGFIRKRLEQRIEDGSVKVVNVSHFDGFDQGRTVPPGYRPREVVMDVEGEVIDLDDDEQQPPDRRVLH
jgi:UPF0716 protein FxsA